MQVHNRPLSILLLFLTLNHCVLASLVTWLLLVGIQHIWLSSATQYLATKNG
jgi:hypothetical protein